MLCTIMCCTQKHPDIYLGLNTQQCPEHTTRDTNPCPYIWHWFKVDVFSSETRQQEAHSQPGTKSAPTTTSNFKDIYRYTGMRGAEAQRLDLAGIL